MTGDFFFLLILSFVSMAMSGIRTDDSDCQIGVLLPELLATLTNDNFFNIKLCLFYMAKKVCKNN